MEAHLEDLKLLRNAKEFSFLLDLEKIKSNSKIILNLVTVDNKFFIDWLFFIKKEIEAGIIF
jgi:hypothetical protein